MQPQTPPVRKHSEGYVLVGVVILAFTMGIIGMAYFALAGYETRDTQIDLASQRAFWLAEAGKERAIADLQGRSYPPPTNERIFENQIGPDGGTYTVDCLVDSSGMWQVEKRFVLDCVGTSGGVQRRIRDRIKMTSFAQYGYFTHGEQSPGGSVIWFYTSDQIHGLVHSNGTFHIQGNPHFYDEVTSASDRMYGYPSFQVFGPEDWPIGGNNPTFDDGFRLNVPTIPLPTQTLDLMSMAQSGGIHLGNASTIELGKRLDGSLAAGWLRYRNTPPPGNPPWSEARISALLKPVIYCNNAIELSGVLDGELTIASKKNIVIVDDVTYAASAASGAPLPGCNDLLGLVAEDNIVFKDVAATYDLKVDAVMMALDTSITAEHHDTRALAGTLTVWGGLIQKYRGAVGTMENGHIKTGYIKDYHYDSRVTARTPPGFPLTGVYQEVAWSETWDASSPF